MEVRFNTHNIQTIHPPRLLSEEERAFVEFLLRPSFPGDKELRQQLSVARVSAQCTTCPTIVFSLDTSSTPYAPVIDRIPTEAESAGAVSDKTVHALLHVVHGYLSELEVYQNDLGQISSLPALFSLAVSTPGSEP